MDNIISSAQHENIYRISSLHWPVIVSVLAPKTTCSRTEIPVSVHFLVMITHLPEDHLLFLETYFYGDGTVFLMSAPGLSVLPKPSH